LVKARSWRYAPVDSCVDLRETRGLEARVTRDLEAAGEENARNWPVKAGARRARRPQRAMV
jgi:hypothetical protein